jgi:hypothetical protein
MERGTHLRRGGGRPPEIRRPSGPKEEEFLRPPSIVVFIYLFDYWAVILGIVVPSPSSSWAKQVLWQGREGNDKGRGETSMGGGNRRAATPWFAACSAFLCAKKEDVPFAARRVHQNQNLPKIP